MIKAPDPLIVPEKRRILYVIENDCYGGGEFGFEKLATRLDRKRFEPAVAAGPGGPFEEAIRCSDVPFFPIRFGGQFSLRAAGDIQEALTRFSPHIVHSQGKRADFHAALASLNIRRVRKICTVQMPVEGFPISRWRKAAYRMVDRWLDRRFDRIIVVSEALRELLVDGHGIDQDRVVKIYNGVDPSDYTPAKIHPSAVRLELGLEGNGPWVGCIGRLVWQKGFDVFLRAAPSVLAALPDTRFVIIGEGPLKSQLARLSEQTRVADKVRFIGFTRNIPRILAALDAVAIPSRREGLPNILLEAMAAEKAIVAGDIPGIREATVPDVSALLVAPENPQALAEGLIRVLREPTLAQSLGSAGRRHVAERFSLDVMIDQTSALYLGLDAATAA